MSSGGSAYVGGNGVVRGRYLIGLGLLLLAGIVIFFVSGARQAISENIERDKLLPVQAAPLVLQSSYDVSARYAGRITARRSSNLGFERPGLLATVTVDEGAEVKEGDVLASLDTRSLEAQLAQARAAEAEASARLSLADVTVNRQRQLLERKNVSQQRYDDARFNRQAVQAQLAAARANIRALDVALELASIRAPYDGHVVARMVDEGTVVNAGQPIFRLLESARLEARIGIPASVLDTLAEGTIYQVEVRGELYPAVLSQVLSEVDSETRTATAIFLVEAPFSRVRSGELARVSLTQTINEAGYWVPIEALTEGRRGLWAIFALVTPEPDEDGTQPGEKERILERRTVQLLHTEADRAYVRGTLSDGEMVVSRGTHRMAPGQRVRLSDGVASAATPAAPAATGSGK